jgi:bifunctional DNA-binding transcriptional regulator/antitoxin component of YhaV-PrlF toxin-antitoxin module
MNIIKVNENFYLTIPPEIVLELGYKQDEEFIYKKKDNCIILEPIKQKGARPFGDLLGCLEGRISVSNDFDEPMDDMKEYM